VAYEDEYYAMPSSLLYPKPVQKPHPPVHILGQSGAPLKRVVDLGDGFFPIGQTPGQMASLVRELEDLLRAQGRPRSAITVSATPYTEPCDVAKVERYRDAGVDQVVLFGFVERIEDLEPVIAGFAETVAVPGRRI
jgi:alkanesulfonate monooxygenase SsuD/methylene tetrahydromethanopterin reductase-like flavin-dependent oxidoreductase (luciferase family)